jgi:HSP20 family protein
VFAIVPFNFRTNPAKMKDSWEKLMETVLDQPMNPLHKVSAVFSSFKVDVKDKGTAYEIKADLPGFEKEEIRLSYQDQCLTISAEKEEYKQAETERYICRERHHGKLERSFYVDDIAEDKIKAEFKEGVLTVILQKITTIADHKKIPID